MKIPHILLSAGSLPRSNAPQSTSHHFYSVSVANLYFECHNFSSALRYPIPSLPFLTCFLSFPKRSIMSATTPKRCDIDASSSGAESTETVSPEGVDRP